MYADTTSVITAVSGLFVGFGVLITAYATFQNSKNIKQGNAVGRATHSDVKLGNLTTADIQYQVTTLNGKTIAVLADDDESRRIYAKARADRTEGDEAHIANVPPPS